MKSLHIGRNNLIGKAYFSNIDCDVISHDELDRHSDYYENVSISAFDPKLKSSIMGNDDFIFNILEKFDRNVNITYFSTARVLEHKTHNHSYYVANKIATEAALSRHFRSVNIIYLPLVYLQKSNLRSRFLTQYLDNLSKDFIHFDCSAVSSWNFVDAIELVRTIDELPYHGINRFLMLGDQVFVNDLTRLALEMNQRVKSVSVGGVDIHYPIYHTPRADLHIKHISANKTMLLKHIQEAWEPKNDDK